LYAKLFGTSIADEDEKKDKGRIEFPVVGPPMAAGIPAALGRRRVLGLDKTNIPHAA
jgi:hypothetical protein